MKDRAIGIETEFGVMMEDKNGRMTPTSSALPLPDMRKRPREGYSSGSRIWFPNGGCVYSDIGHPEYASPEVRRAKEAVLYSKAGEFLATRVFPREGRDGRNFILVKNNLGIGENYRDTGLSFGCHENYMLRGWNVYSRTLHTHLIPFLATRHIYGGAGWWLGGGRFSLSQRALVIESNSGAQTTKSRPIITTREESHASGQISRLHLILGDSNILDFPLFLKAGATSLVLSMMEDKNYFERKAVNAVHAMKRSAGNAGPAAPVMVFEDGTRMSALDVQEMYLESVMHYLDNTSFPSEETEAESRLIVRCWQDALNAISLQDTDWMLGRFDYATKRYLTEKTLEKKSPISEDEKDRIRKNIDILYHGVTDRRFIERVERKWSSRRLVSDEEVQKATREPPKDTRARLRGKAVRLFSDRREESATLNWRYVKHNNNEFKIKKPLAYRHDALESYMIELQESE